MKYVHTPDAPEPAGHYSQAVVHDGRVYVAGQLPIDPTDPRGDPGDVEAQTRLVFQNMAAILEKADSGLDRILQLNVFVSELDSWGTVNKVIAEVLGEHKPARAVVPVQPLKRGLALEVTAIAAQR
jgi:2-iminobutanoate/2-iminopropanoate deaminase